MTALAAATWLLAVVVLATVIVSRVSDADQRWRPAVQLASFNELLIPLGAAPWVVVDALHLAGVIPFHAPGLVLLAPPLALAAALVLAGPTFTGRGQGTAGGPEIRLATANIERDGHDPVAAACDVLALDADVVLLQEYTPATQAACREAGLIDAYPHAWEAALDSWFGCAVFSRHPLPHGELREIGERPMGVVSLQVGRRSVTLVNVHVQAPIYQRDIAPWHDAFIDLAELAAELEEPVVMGGDWNATGTHQPMRDLLDRGTLVDAHRATHRLWPRTWPVGRRVPPLVCLDHVLVSPTIEVLGTTEVTIADTDHRALCVGLRLP